jgi:hypothetical protein
MFKTTVQWNTLTNLSMSMKMSSTRRFLKSYFRVGKQFLSAEVEAEARILRSRNSNFKNKAGKRIWKMKTKKEDI